MKFVPSPWSASWLERFTAIVLGIFLPAGLGVAVERGSWIVALVWVVLIVGAIVSWGRDFRRAMKK
jgi:uncharacterized membrane protein YqaE (UPF0057 family)